VPCLTCLTVEDVFRVVRDGGASLTVAILFLRDIIKLVPFLAREGGALPWPVTLAPAFSGPLRQKTYGNGSGDLCMSAGGPGPGIS